MGLFTRLFKKESKALPIEPSNRSIDTNSEDRTLRDEWKAVPAYIEANAEDYQLVSLIATAIATGDQPNSQFVVKKILQRNPEAKLVSLISASIAEASNTSSHSLVVKKIYKKN
ncbi:hypothetical protein CBF34_01415 [Vagococcus penaei]|uniref:Uncharacterized protein n=1 Tax=Vagococcus penaei TaxID=633807 RepID=A0A1Q2D898_9ENTE|nr:hypothetical protein [Vagococcus penaei]AQP54525.1 hypothetical protein BW732_10120 [Vagococcus penaei]RSU06767.1 hypothetical protein CBF34_01415 [Vagococcus penaei]